MRASLRMHLHVQRGSLLKVALYSGEAFVLCFAGMWLLYSEKSLYGKLLASGIFAAAVLVIGVTAVLLASYGAAKGEDRGAGDDKGV